MSARWRIAVSVALGLGGVAVIAYFVHATRLAELRHALSQLAVWIPVLFVLEGARIAVEAAGTRALYGLGRDRLPTGLLLRAHVLGYGLAFYLPAGRATAEAVKATLLAKCATPARAAAVAAANQSLALLGLAIAATACLVGSAFVAGSGRLVAGLALVAGATGTLAIILRVAALRTPGRWVRRVAPRLAAMVGDARGEVPQWVPAFPLAMFVVSRALQLGSLAIVIAALTGHVTVVATLVAGGVNLVGASLGDMVPGQLGATDATFSMSAGLVGLSPEAAISIALVIHVVQLSWMAIGLGLELALRVAAWRSLPGRERGP